jgi:hypothetical protein
MSSSSLPTFIIGGSPRSGTTYLAEALACHPDIYMARPIIPEPKVFIGPPQPLDTYWDRYRAIFPPSSTQRARGEKSSGYLENPELAALIQAVVPEVRLLFIFREPVARAYSNYLWSRKNGLETLSFEQAVAEEGTRLSPLAALKPHVKPFAYLERGAYFHLTSRYLERFGADNVLFVLYEDIAARPTRLFAQIQDFIGVDRVPHDRLDVGVVNSAKEVGPPIAPKTRERLREQMEPDVKRFAVLTGLDISPWGY